jgi:ISXO2-like transposase domain
MKRWGLGTYHGLRRKHVDTYLNEFVFRYNRRFYRHVSFETILGLASHHHPTSYWEIVGRDNPRKGVPTVRRQPRRRRTATGMQQDGSSLPQNSRASIASGVPLLKR